MPFKMETFDRFLLVYAIQTLGGATFFLIFRSVNAMFIDTCWFIGALLDDLMATLNHINQMIIVEKASRVLVERQFIECVELHTRIYQ